MAVKKIKKVTKPVETEEVEEVVVEAEEVEEVVVEEKETKKPVKKPTIKSVTTSTTKAVTKAEKEVKPKTKKINEKLSLDKARKSKEVEIKEFSSVTRDELAKLFLKALQEADVDINNISTADSIIRIFESVVRENILDRFNTAQLFGLNITRKKVKGRIYSLAKGTLDTVPNGSKVYVKPHYKMVLAYAPNKEKVTKGVDKLTEDDIAAQNQKFFNGIVDDEEE